MHHGCQGGGIADTSGVIDTSSISTGHENTGETLLLNLTKHEWSGFIQHVKLSVSAPSQSSTCTLSQLNLFQPALNVLLLLELIFFFFLFNKQIIILIISIFFLMSILSVLNVNNTRQIRINKMLIL